MVIRRQTSKRTKRPRVRGPPRPHRVQMREDTTKLFDWVQRKRGSREALTFNMALTSKYYTSYFAK